MNVEGSEMKSNKERSEVESLQKEKTDVHEVRILTLCRWFYIYCTYINKHWNARVLIFDVYVVT